MSEPSVDFDWESVEPSSIHLARNKAFRDLIEQEVKRRVTEERHAIAEQAIRKFLSLVLSRHALAVDLQHNFALNQPLSAFALAASAFVQAEVEGNPSTVAKAKAGKK